MSLRFEKKSPKIFTAKMRCLRQRSDGRPFRSDDAVRAIQERDHWYTDKTTSVAGEYLPWESVIVHNKKRWRTLDEAKEALNEYARQCGAFD